jgi:osmotically-inducible protein OsmY
MATTTEARSDAELKTDAEAELEWDPRVHRNEIGVAVIKEKIQRALVRSAETEADRIIVQVDGGKVTLRGAVRSYAEKQDAERAARAAPGVISVDNRISLSPF